MDAKKFDYETEFNKMVMKIDDDCTDDEYYNMIDEYQNTLCNMLLNQDPDGDWVDEEFEEMEKLDYILWYILKGYDTNDYSIDILTPIPIDYISLILKDSDYIEQKYNSFKRRFDRHYYNDEPY